MAFPSYRNPNLGKLTEEDTRQILIDHHSIVEPFYLVTADDYTTTGSVAHEHILTDSTGTGTHTISLHTNPRVGDRVSVKRGGTKAVTVDTDGSETIDGAASVSLASQYDTNTFLALNDSSTDTTSVNWSIWATG